MVQTFGAKINRKIIFDRRVEGVTHRSMVNEVIRTILSLVIFFYENVLSSQKRKSNQNQLTKQK